MKSAAIGSKTSWAIAMAWGLMILAEAPASAQSSDPRGLPSSEGPPTQPELVIVANADNNKTKNEIEQQILSSANQVLQAKTGDRSARLADDAVLAKKVSKREYKILEDILIWGLLTPDSSTKGVPSFRPRVREGKREVGP